MILRALTFVGGLSGAVGLSQFPEFSQQYIQRLGGAVDELTRVVAEFDEDAAAVGLSREAALVDLATGGRMGAAQAETMVETINRKQRLEADLDLLQGTSAFQRAGLIPHLSDPEIAARTWDSYKPAVPATLPGGVFALVGYVFGSILIGVALRVLALPWRLQRRKRSA